MTSYNASDDHCRVGAFSLLSSNGTPYCLELSFSKTTQAAGLLNFGLDTGLALLARTAAPIAGIRVDAANRRIGFAGVVVGGANGSNSSNSVTLDGPLEYPTHIDPAARAACG